MKPTHPSSNNNNDDDNMSKASSDSLASIPEELSSVASTSGHTSDNNNNELNREKNQVQKLAKNESKHVKIWRRNVVMVLAGMCVLVT
jgi:site-specific DNA-adenine methylase